MVILFLNKILNLFWRNFASGLFIVLFFVEQPNYNLATQKKK